MKKLIALTLALMMIFALTGCASKDYKTAGELRSSGSYVSAAEMYTALGDYKDSAALATDCNYKQAMALYEQEDYAGAAELFRALGEYELSASYLKKAEKVILEQAVVGKWLSEELDAGETFLGEIEANMGSNEETQALWDCCTFSPFYVKYEIVFNENGTFLLKMEEETVNASVDKFLREFTDGVTAYCYQVTVDSLAEIDYTMEDAIKELEVETEADVVEYVVGMKPEDLVTEILPADTLKSLFNVESSGVYTAEDGKLNLTVGTTTEIYTYDAASDVLTGSDKDLKLDSFTLKRS